MIFSTRKNSGFALDAGLVEKLVADKLDAEGEKLRVEGWKWVEPAKTVPNDANYMRRVYPHQVELTEEEQAEVDLLEAENDDLAAEIEAGEADENAEPRVEAIQARLAVLLAAREAYSAADTAKAGCYVAMDYYGNVEIERGLVRPDDEDKEEEESDEKDECDTDESEDGGSTVTPHPEPSYERPFKLPEPMVKELTAQKTAAIRAELAHNPDVALAAVVHAMLVNLFGSYGSNEHTCLEMTVKSEALKTSIADPAACKGIVRWTNSRKTRPHHSRQSGRSHGLVPRTADVNASRLAGLCGCKVGERGEVGLP
ncbi:hypothetical protein [Shinella sp. HZN7]|uniref:hypothetical protein n=1 Tax=Shinella sp. (strain HZN7) TaxID=879274 RepID=UPI001FD8F82A|nr:hypothetical protein [Shinella sp. HZN7]